MKGFSRGRVGVPVKRRRITMKSGIFTCLCECRNVNYHLVVNVASEAWNQDQGNHHQLGAISHASILVWCRDHGGV